MIKHGDKVNVYQQEGKKAVTYYYLFAISSSW